MHITNQKLSFDVVMVGNLQKNKNKWPIQCIVGYCYKYAGATGFVVQGHICKIFSFDYVTVENGTVLLDVLSKCILFKSII